MMFLARKIKRYCYRFIGLRPRKVSHQSRAAWVRFCGQREAVQRGDQPWIATVLRRPRGAAGLIMGVLGALWVQENARDLTIAISRLQARSEWDIVDFQRLERGV